jgi:hypothetical protein
MAHTTINGIQVSSVADGLREDPEWSGAVDERADDGSLFTSETTRKRRWQLQTTPMVAEEGEALRRLVEREGFAVGFDTAFALKGLAPTPASSWTRQATGGRFGGGRAAVTSGGRLEYALGTKLIPGRTWSPTVDGWTIIVHKKLDTDEGGDGTSYVHHLATGKTTFARNAAVNPPGVTQYRRGLPGSWSMGRWLHVEADGDVAVWGFDNANVAAAYDYDDLVVLPFAVTASWAAQLAAFGAAFAYPETPLLLLQGDAIPEPAGALVSGRVTSVQQRNMILQHRARNNARVLDLVLSER